MTATYLHLPLERPEPEPTAAVVLQQVIEWLRDGATIRAADRTGWILRCFPDGTWWPGVVVECPTSEGFVPLTEREQRACQAIKYILDRIGAEADVAYRLGAGTQTFELLTASYAELSGTPVDTVRNEILPGSAAIHRREDR